MCMGYCLQFTKRTSRVKPARRGQDRGPTPDAMLAQANNFSFRLSFLSPQPALTGQFISAGLIALFGVVNAKHSPLWNPELTPASAPGVALENAAVGASGRQRVSPVRLHKQPPRWAGPASSRGEMLMVLNPETRPEL